LHGRFLGLLLAACAAAALCPAPGLWLKGLSLGEFALLGQRARLGLPTLLLALLLANAGLGVRLDGLRRLPRLASNEAQRHRPLRGSCTSRPAGAATLPAEASRAFPTGRRPPTTRGMAGRNAWRSPRRPDDAPRPPKAFSSMIHRILMRGAVAYPLSPASGLRPPTPPADEAAARLRALPKEGAAPPRDGEEE
jgi:hypothetical protein